MPIILINVIVICCSHFNCYNYSSYILQISFASATSELSDRARFQYYFRTTPSFVNYVTAILGILNKYKWKQLAFITQNSGTFLKV